MYNERNEEIFVDRSNLSPPMPLVIKEPQEFQERILPDNPRICVLFPETRFLIISLYLSPAKIPENGSRDTL